MNKHKQYKGAQRCVAPANMAVTVAVEAARKRGFLSKEDTQHLSDADAYEYVQLAEKEWGIVTWL